MDHITKTYHYTIHLILLNMEIIEGFSENENWSDFHKLAFKHANNLTFMNMLLFRIYPHCIEIMNLIIE